MKARLTAIAAGMALVLTACGGGGGGSANSIPVAQASISVASLIQSFGDSTMEGFASTSKTTGAYTPLNAPYNLQRDLQGIYGVAATVSDEGVGATTLAQLINDTDGEHPAWATEMQKSKAKIVIVNHALNDDVIKETLDQYRALLIEFVSTARQYGKTPVLEEPNPSCDPARANLGDFVSVMDQVASDMGVPLVSQWAYIQTLPNWQSYFADCIHPNPAMYQIKAQREAVVLSPLVAKLL
jgi:lysophospholipase L1-like esterase